MTLNLRVSLDFAGYSDADLDIFASNVAACLGTPSFPTPPVTPVALGGLVSAFHDAVLAALPGGIQLTAAKNAAREPLLDALRQDAAYVQSIASHNLDVLLTSGFYANSTNRTQVPLVTPSITDLENVASTQLLVRLSPITNARSYHVQTSIGDSAWQDGGVYTQARRIVLTNLASGTTYTVRARAIGGSTGSSDWSKPVSSIVT